MTRDSDEDAGWNGVLLPDSGRQRERDRVRCWRQSVTDPRRPKEDGVPRWCTRTGGYAGLSYFVSIAGDGVTAKTQGLIFPGSFPPKP